MLLLEKPKLLTFYILDLIKRYFYRMKHIIEAHRYLENAKEILIDKAQKEDGYYKDKKYVKLAGHAAYTGILVALDAYFGIKSKGRKSVDRY